MDARCALAPASARARKMGCMGGPLRLSGCQPHLAERCRSGRTGRFRKPLSLHGFPGFESLSLRQITCQHAACVSLDTFCALEACMVWSRMRSFPRRIRSPPHCALCQTGLQTARPRSAGPCLFLERRGTCQVEIEGIDTLSNALVNDIKETMCKNGALFWMTAPTPLLKVQVHPSRKAACRISGRIYL